MCKLRLLHEQYIYNALMAAKSRDDEKVCRWLQAYMSLQIGIQPLLDMIPLLDATDPEARKFMMSHLCVYTGEDGKTHVRVAAEKGAN